MISFIAIIGLLVILAIIIIKIFQWNWKEVLYDTCICCGRETTLQELDTYDDKCIACYDKFYGSGIPALDEQDHF